MCGGLNKHTVPDQSVMLILCILYVYLSVCLSVCLSSVDCLPSLIQQLCICITNWLCLACSFINVVSRALARSRLFSALSVVKNIFSRTVVSHLIIQMVMCFCRIPRSFLNTKDVHHPYDIGVVSFLDILAERENFAPPPPLEKLIVFEVPKFSQNFWKKLHNVPILDTLTFVDHSPQYFMPNASPPPFFLIPKGIPPPHQHVLTHRTLLPTIPPTPCHEIPCYFLQ